MGWVKEVDINALSREYQDTQHFIVGCVNLGARIAPYVSRKGQEILFLKIIKREV